ISHFWLHKVIIPIISIIRPSSSGLHLQAFIFIFDYHFGDDSDRSPHNGKSIEKRSFVYSIIPNKVRQTYPFWERQVLVMEPSDHLVWIYCLLFRWFPLSLLIEVERLRDVGHSGDRSGKVEK